MNVEIKEDKVIIPKDQYNEESEINYLNFVLGYDLLNDMFKKSKSPECDLSYDFCDYLSRQFIKSEEYQNTNYSTYDMLVKWLENNKTKINKEYQEFIEGDIKSKTRKLDNGIFIIDLGYRREQPIALIEKSYEDYREYIIAINYKIKDNKMEWGYGYYYDKNLNKAKEDFDKVISGGNLTNTFEKKGREER
ncbi:MAG: hypothetical protein ACI4VL_00520 [Bacilli bacterium]